MDEKFTGNEPQNRHDASDNTDVESLAPLSKPAPGTNIKTEKCSVSDTNTLLATESIDTIEVHANERQPLDISRHLRLPRFANIKPNIISHEQALSGIIVNIPGSAMMRFGDTLVFYWGQNKSSTPLLLHTISNDSTVRVLCISYQFITHLQYGLVDVYYEVYRGPQLIGTSPAARITVQRVPSQATTPDSAV